MYTHGFRHGIACNRGVTHSVDSRSQTVQCERALPPRPRFRRGNNGKCKSRRKLFHAILRVTRTNSPLIRAIVRPHHRAIATPGCIQLEISRVITFARLSSKFRGTREIFRCRASMLAQQRSTFRDGGDGVIENNYCA